jgi:uncharacterized membrane protein
MIDIQRTPDTIAGLVRRPLTLRAEKRGRPGGPPCTPFYQVPPGDMATLWRTARARDRVMGGAPQPKGEPLLLWFLSALIVASLLPILAPPGALPRNLDHERGAAFGCALALTLLLSRLLAFRIGSLPLVKALGPARRVASEHPRRVLVGLVLAAGSILAAAAIHRHLGLRSSALDLGIFDQVVWGVGHGNGLRSSLKGGTSILGDHFEPILVLLAPLYFLWDSPLCLLAFQAFVLSSAAVPVFLLARQRLGPSSSLMVAASLLAFLPMRSLALVDYHPETIAVPLLAWALLALSRERPVLFLATIGLACLCKESTSLAAFGIGVASAIFGSTRMERTLGVVCAAASGTIFVLAVAVVIPHFRGGPNIYLGRYAYLGATNFGTLLLAPFRHPITFARALILPADKIRYLLQLFAPLAFLPFLRPRWIVALAPVLVMNLLSEYPLMHAIHNQYTAELIPVLFAGVIDSVGTVWGRRVLDTPLLLILAVVAWGTSEPFGEFWIPITDRDRAVETALQRIPASAAVSAQLFSVPHVSHRQDVFLLPELGSAEFVGFDLKEPFPDGHMDPAGNQAQLRELLSSGASVEVEFDGFYLLHLRR